MLDLVWPLLSKSTALTRKGAQNAAKVKLRSGKNHLLKLMWSDVYLRVMSSGLET